MKTVPETKPIAVYIAWAFAIAMVSVLLTLLAIRHANREIAATTPPAEQSLNHEGPDYHVPEDQTAVFREMVLPVHSEGMPESNYQLIMDLRKQAEASAKSDAGPSALAVTEEQIRFIEENNLIAQ